MSFPARKIFHETVNRLEWKPLFALDRTFGQGPQGPVDQPFIEEIMSKLFAAVIAAVFAVATVAPAFAAEKKEAAKVDCKDAKNKDHKDCKAKKK
jgi:hypothetical protein